MGAVPPITMKIIVFCERLGTSVLAVDLRNHGQSPWISEETMTFDRMAADIHGFIAKHVGADERVALIGHSLV